MIQSIIKPKAPKGEGWIYYGAGPDLTGGGFEVQRWYYPDQGFFVLSAVEVAHDPNDIEKGPEYHVSLSNRKYGHPVRVDRNGARFVLKAFGMEDADEDNHVPGGVVRNYWRPVAEKLVGHVCPCKDEEPAMVEDKGDFVWRGV